MTDKKRKLSSLTKKQTRAGYIFVLPAIVGVLLLFFPMIAETVWFSLSNVKVTRTGYTASFTGLNHYISLLSTNAWYLQNALASLGDMLIDFFSVMIFSFFVAVLLNQKFKGRTLARVIFFLPVILSTGIIATLDVQDTVVSAVTAGTSLNIGTSSLGMPDIYDILSVFSMPLSLYQFVTGLIEGLYFIIISSGVQILLFLTALHSVSPQIYESAKVEGATGWESFWKITLPMISPVIQVNGIYTLIDSCTKSTNVIMSQVLNDTMQMAYSQAAAEAIIYLLAVSLFIGIFTGISNKLVFYQE